MGFATYLKGLKKQDEWYTPKEAVIPLLKHVPKEWTIWCPFDKESSEFVQVFRGGGHKVICSHIEDGKDFFTYEPDEHYPQCGTVHDRDINAARNILAKALADKAA